MPNAHNQSPRAKSNTENLITQTNPTDSITEKGEGEQNWRNPPAILDDITYELR